MGVFWGVEVTEALLGQVSVLVVVEGLSRQLREEVGTIPRAASALAQRAAGGCQRLCAAGAAHATKDGRQEGCSLGSVTIIC